MESIDVTIIVPIYNSEKYLRECLDSICAQTYRDWKCVLVNDGSTDRSQQIIDEYCAKDSRFSCMVKENEKSCAKAKYYPLDKITSEWVMSVDSDDAIEPMYVEKLVRRYWETKADLVTGQLIYCKEELCGEVGRLPSPEFDLSKVISGHDRCEMTIGGWKIGGSGITKREYYLKTKPGPYINSDEYNSRLRMLLAKQNAFTDAKYYYRANEGSSISVSSRMFERALVDQQIEQLVIDNFPGRDDLLIAISYQRLFNLIYLTADYYLNKNRFDQDEKKYAVSILKKSHDSINRKMASKAAPYHTLMLTHSFKIFSFLATAYVRYKRNHGGIYYYK